MYASLNLCTFYKLLRRSLLREPQFFYIPLPHPFLCDRIS
nr:MAG TPA: hypothetical protein [Caudoviricetes sp.]DAZ16604.1 MAG TPA: hypothetical protein [Caudoviricetes sp.]